MTALDASPSILPLYVKSALPLIPGASALPFVPGGGNEIPPELAFELEGVRPDTRQVAEYAKVCGFPLRESLPVTFPHILAFPLHMAIMSDGSFPFGAVGLVHIENSIDQIRPVGIGETLDLRVSSTPLMPHPKGRSFSLLTEVLSGGETVWTETSTMLRRGKGGGEAGELVDPIPSIPADAPASATWALPGDLGRRYGAVSGDCNPIHMHALTARPLGFHSAIAHGMWTKARAIAQLDNRLPDSFTAETRFRKPVFLPSTVEFSSTESSDQILFSVRNARKATPHLDGRIRPHSPSTAKASN